jgi:hypothetical protein
MAWRNATVVAGRFRRPELKAIEGNPESPAHRMGQRIKLLNHCIGFGRPIAGCLLVTVAWRSVRGNRLQKVVGAPIMKEEYALADAPQRRGPEHVTRRGSLCDVVSQALAHQVRSTR